MSRGRETRADFPRVRGFIAAPFTPMNQGGSLNLSAVDAYAAHLISTGVSGVFVNGTTGEGYSLSVEERRVAAERWMANRNGVLRVLVHVGAESMEEARSLASHAASIGADGIATMSPVFFRPDLDGIVEWCRLLAESAPEIPFYFYHMPTATGTTFSLARLLEGAGTKIPNFAGVKYTHNDLMEYRLCADLEEGRYDMLFGRDEILLSAITIGATGMVGSTYNYAMRVHSQTTQSFREGRLADADRAQFKVMKLANLLASNGGGVICGKAMMRGVGLDMGPCRPPLATLSEESVAAVLARAQALGVFP